MKKLLFLLTIFIAGCTTAGLSMEISEDIKKCRKLYAERDYHAVNVINVKTHTRTREEIGIISIRGRIICWYPK